MQRQFALRPSRYLAALLSAAHAGALAALVPLSLPSWAKLALAALVLTSWLFQLRRTAWLSAPASVVAFSLEENRVTWCTRSGKRLNGKIMHDSLVTPWLTILNLLPQDARLAHSIVLLHDSLDAEAFRQLRVWLKWGNA